MIYHLNEAEQMQIQTWIPLIQDYYAESDAVQLAAILQNALSNGFVDEKEIYRLLDLLPQIIPGPHEEIKGADASEETGWDAYISEQQARYKREMNKFRQLLSNRIFLQNAVYRRDPEPLLKQSERGISGANDHGMQRNR